MLRVMKRAGEVGSVWTARSGKPMATLKRPDGSIEFRVFEEVEDVRAAMGEAAKERERTEDNEKADARGGFAQEEVRVKQQFKEAYLTTERRKTYMKMECAKAGVKFEQAIDRVDLEMARSNRLRYIGRSRHQRRLGFTAPGKDRRNDAAKEAARQSPSTNGAGPSPGTSGGSSAGGTGEATSGVADGDDDVTDLGTEEDDINSLIEPEPEKLWEDMVTEEANAEKSGAETGKK